MFIRRISVRRGRRAAVTGPWLLAWLSVTVAILLVAPSVANAAWMLSGKTSQGFSDRLRVFNNLSKVNRFVIRWQARCATGATYKETTLIGPFVIRDFPKFNATGVATSPIQVNGQTLSFTVSTNLHGRLMLNVRARGTWSAKVAVRNASGTQIDSCSSGLIRWTAHG